MPLADTKVKRKYAGGEKGRSAVVCGWRRGPCGRRAGRGRRSAGGAGDRRAVVAGPVHWAGGVNRRAGRRRYTFVPESVTRAGRYTFVERMCIDQGRSASASNRATAMPQRLPSRPRLPAALIAASRRASQRGLAAGPPPHTRRAARGTCRSRGRPRCCSS